MSGWTNSLIPQIQDEWWMLLIAAMTNVACALLGCYLVLRRVSLLGDALSHAVLPGLVLAYIFSGSLAIGYMFAGALLTGLLTTFLVQTIQQRGGVPSDASMGVVFTSLFALGVVLIKRYAQGVDLDAECVLQGQLVLAPMIRLELLGNSVPRAVVSIAPALLANLVFIALFWKELKISSFDPALATTMGLSAGVMHYLLMALVATTTVGSFEAVGSILVIAMLIVPGATAHLLSDRLRNMLVIAAGVGLLSAYAGFVGAMAVPGASPAGMMSVAAGLMYALAVFFSPRYGIVSKLSRNAQTSLRIIREDLLAMLYRLEELSVGRRMGPREAVQAVGGGVLSAWGLWTLVRRGNIERNGGGLQLTESGRRKASHLVRSHRLWEAYLVEYLGLPLDHVHGPAERMEHYIGERLQEKIVADLNATNRDPHGRDIPSAL